jgi:hypothetical protein
MAPNELITCDPIPIPKHWARINGLDFGWDHPFAAISLAQYSAMNVTNVMSSLYLTYLPVNC